MCRPPDFRPSPASNFSDDALQAEDSYEWDENAALEAALLQANSSSLLGKRGFLNDGGLADEISRAVKMPRGATSISSAFDTAAASFMVKMEQSMLQDLQRQQHQHQQSFSSPSAPVGDALLRRALMEQQSQFEQLQQLQMLKQLQAANQAPSVPQLLPEQRQLLAAQQQLLRQSRAASLAAAPANEVPGWSENAKLQAMLLQGLGSVNPRAPAVLPPVAPKLSAPPPTALSALLGTNGSPATGFLGFGAPALPSFHSAALVFDDERKVKRMQSNRASAKRSRQRRQARLEELDKSTAGLQDENSSLCNKLEAAHEQIHALEEENWSLTTEVTELRRMLGMTAHSSSDDCLKSEMDAAVSSGVPEASCGASGNNVHASAGSAPVVKAEADIAEDFSEDEGIDQLKGFLDIGDSEAQCLDQLLPQGDVLLELLACLNG